MRRAASSGRRSASGTCNSSGSSVAERAAQSRTETPAAALTRVELREFRAQCLLLGRRLGSEGDGGGANLQAISRRQRLPRLPRFAALAPLRRRQCMPRGQALLQDLLLRRRHGLPLRIARQQRVLHIRRQLRQPSSRSGGNARAAPSPAAGPATATSRRDQRAGRGTIGRLVAVATREAPHRETRPAYPGRLRWPCAPRTTHRNPCPPRGLVAWIDQRSKSGSVSTRGVAIEGLRRRMRPPAMPPPARTGRVIAIGCAPARSRRTPPRRRQRQPEHHERRIAARGARAPDPAAMAKQSVQASRARIERLADTRVATATSACQRPGPARRLACAAGPGAARARRLHGDAETAAASCVQPGDEPQQQDHAQPRRERRQGARDRWPGARLGTAQRRRAPAGSRSCGSSARPGHAPVRAPTPGPRRPAPLARAAVAAQQLGEHAGARTGLAQDRDQGRGGAATGERKGAVMGPTMRASWAG